MGEDCFLIPFSDPQGTDHSLVGGKASSLGRLTAAGFDIPSGITINTHGYSYFLRHNQIDEVIASAILAIDFSNVNDLEQKTALIRASIDKGKIPSDLESAIRMAYQSLGDNVYVAVRSSGTAEDLADASFAGLHDTYLDVRGEDELLEAVKNCWASLWTARCTAYRQNGGYDHQASLLAVTIQEMVKSETAGVLFTGNPLNARSDHFVINASWGLGEGVVSGILTPDEFIFDRKSLKIKSKILGSKEWEIVSDPDRSSGTAKLSVSEARRSEFCIDDTQVADLAVLGEKVMNYYGGLPQDIEWAYAKGRLYLLQSRNITGVPFTWDEDVDGWQTLPSPDDTVWSHAFADEFWTGAISPLFYSIRAREVHNTNLHDFALWGFDDLSEIRSLKWYNGTAYYNSNSDRDYDEYLFPPSLRGGTLWKIPPDWREDAAQAPFDIVQGIFTQLRILLLEPSRGLTRWFDEVDDFMYKRILEADGPSRENLTKYSDRELRKSTQFTLDLAERFLGLLRPAFHYYGVMIPGLLSQMVRAWYKGENKFIFQELISGLPRQTKTVEETRAVWRVVQILARSEFLRNLFNQHRGLEFFTKLEESDEGRQFLEVYREELLIPHGHRGHADRDLWYTRRVEDYSLDYEAFRSFLAAEGGPTPEELEHRLINVRKRAMKEMIESIQGTPLANVKIHSFKLLHAYVLKFLMVRDDERHYIDRITLAKKSHFMEIGRRLFDRGFLQGPEDFYLLSEEEIYEVWEGKAQLPLVHAKVTNRRKIFEGHLAREILVSTYIDNEGRPYAVEDGDTESGPSNGVFSGVGVSRGSVTARARVIKDLKDIGRVEKGDILICNSTDPGWASIFAIISGLVMETGGMLAHGSCLSREYGLPAVTLRNAMSMIQDGALITINGDIGEIVVQDS